MPEDGQQAQFVPFSHDLPGAWGYINIVSYIRSGTFCYRSRTLDNLITHLSYRFHWEIDPRLNR